MIILLVMCAGILAGRFLVPGRVKRLNERIALACTLILIFSMGCYAGTERKLFRGTGETGLFQLLVFSSSDSTFHCICLSFKSEISGEKKENRRKGGERMVVFTILALLLGITCGLLGGESRLLAVFTEHTDLILYILMFSLGSAWECTGDPGETAGIHIRIF